MTSEIYTLEQFVADLDRITTRETAPEAITRESRRSSVGS